MHATRRESTAVLGLCWELGLLTMSTRQCSPLHPRLLTAPGLTAAFWQSTRSLQDG